MNEHIKKSIRPKLTEKGKRFKDAHDNYFKNVKREGAKLRTHDKEEKKETYRSHIYRTLIYDTEKQIVT